MQRLCESPGLAVVSWGNVLAVPCAVDSMSLATASRCTASSRAERSARVATLPSVTMQSIGCDTDAHDMNDARASASATRLIGQKPMLRTLFISSVVEWRRHDGRGGHRR